MSYLTLHKLPSLWVHLLSHHHNNRLTVGLLLPGMFTVLTYGSAAFSVMLCKLLYHSCVMCKSVIISLAHFPINSDYLSDSLNIHCKLLFQATFWKHFVVLCLNISFYGVRSTVLLYPVYDIRFRVNLTVCHLSEGAFLPKSTLLQFSYTSLKSHIQPPTVNPLQVLMSVISARHYSLKIVCTVQQLSLWRRLQFSSCRQAPSCFFHSVGHKVKRRKW